MSEHTGARVLHATDADTEPDEHREGGQWLVFCHACDWAEHGSYSGWMATEADALCLAHQLGTEHEFQYNWSGASTP